MVPLCPSCSDPVCRAFATKQVLDAGSVVCDPSLLLLPVFWFESLAEVAVEVEVSVEVSVLVEVVEVVSAPPLFFEPFLFDVPLLVPAVAAAAVVVVVVVAALPPLLPWPLLAFPESAL